MLNLKIAFNFVVRKPIQSLITIIIITAGVAVFYFIYNASAGLKKIVLQATAETGSHIYIKGDFSYDDRFDFRNQIFSDDKRVTDVSFTLTVPAVANRLFRQTNLPIMVKGVNFDEGGRIQSINSRLRGGSNNIPKTLDDDLNYFGEVAIGNKMARNLGYILDEDAIGKPIKLNIVSDQNTFHEELFKIVGVFYTDYLELSEKVAYTTIETLHKIEGLTSANLIEIKTNNPLTSDFVQLNIEDSVNDYYPSSKISNWQDGNGYIVNALYIEDTSILIIQVFTAVAIAIGLASIITFTVRSKLNQIGILKAMGVSNSSVRMIFLYQVLLFLIIGNISGLYLGDFLSKLFMVVFRRPSSDVPLVTLTVGINNIYSITTVAVMFLSGLIATIIPLRMAEKIKIIEVIKNE